MRVSLPVLSDDEAAEQVRAAKAGLADSTIKRAVNKELADRRERSAALQAEYDGKRGGTFSTRIVEVKDATGKPTEIMATYTVPKG